MNRESAIPHIHRESKQQESRKVQTALDKEFKTEYRNALESYIGTNKERDLYRAYQLGRKALDEADDILDVTRFHADVLLDMLAGLQKEFHGKVIADAHAFFSEFVSPFELTSKGLIDAAVSLKRQIDERQDAEEALQQSERYFRSLIENALDIVTILDKEGTILYISPSGERVFGYSHAEFAGKNILEFVHPEDVDLILELFSTGNDAPFSTARVEFRFRHSNGESLILESIGKKVADSPFVTELVILNSRDITDRRNLEEIRRKYEFIVNASKELMLLVNAEKRLEAVNEACRIALSRNKEDIIGKRIVEILENRAIRTMFAANISKCLSGAEVKDEGWFDLIGSEKRYLEIDCYPYRNNLLTVTHAIVIVRDTTERKIGEDRIRENQRLRAEDLRRYAQLTQRAQEDERRRISRELHDDICQRLTALNFQINVFEDLVGARKRLNKRRLRSVKDEINNLISEVRRISYNLRPSALDHFGLVTAMRLLCSEFEKLHGIQIQFETNVPPHKRFDPEMEIAFYRIAQEALTNCAKHANADAAYLKLAETKSDLSLTLADNGIGFDFGFYVDQRITGKHFGLVNMRERTELLAGTFKVESSCGKGTSINVCVPIKSRKEECEE